jgi:chromosome partitioning protein
MRDFLREVRDDFDLVIIDCPPNLHLCSWAALTASDAVVVPLQPEDYGAQGIAAIQDAIEAVRSATNPRVRLAGYLLTMYDKRLAIHLAYESRLRSLYGADVFAHPVPMAKDFKEAVASRMPVGHYKPRSAAAKATQAVATELLDRLRALAEGRAPGVLAESEAGQGGEIGEDPHTTTEIDTDRDDADGETDEKRRVA